MEDNARLFRALADISPVTREQLELEGINIRVQKMLLNMEKMEVFGDETKEMMIAQKYLKKWKGVGGLEVKRRSLEEELDLFCRSEVREIIESCNIIKQFINTLG